MSNNIEIVDSNDDEFIFDNQDDDNYDSNFNNHVSPDLKVPYLGRMVSKMHFRVYVYGKSGQKLAESYFEFKTLLKTGEWFATQQEYLNSTSQKKPGAKPGRKPKINQPEKIEKPEKEQQTEPVTLKFYDKPIDSDEVIEHGSDS